MQVGLKTLRWADALPSVCSYGDGWLQEVVGGERGLCCMMAELLMNAHPPIILLLLPRDRMRDRGREGGGMREIKDKVILGWG